MKKINYLMSMFAIVLALGVTSCDPNEVTPDNTIDGIQLSDFDGMWSLENVTYNGNDYNCDDYNFTSQLQPNAIMTGLSFNINGTNNKVDFYDCDGTHLFNGFTKTVSFDSNTLEITFDGYKFKIVDYDLTTTPKTASIKLITSSYSGDVVGLTHNVRQ